MESQLNDIKSYVRAIKRGGRIQKNLKKKFGATSKRYHPTPLGIYSSSDTTYDVLECKVVINLLFTQSISMS